MASRFHAAAVVLQAGGRAVARRLLRRSGVTPWDKRYAGISARETECADRARPLTPDEIGWSTPPLSLPGSRRMRWIAAELARAFLSGPFEQDGLTGRGAACLGRRWRWLRPLCGRVIAAFPAGKPLRRARLAEFLRHDPGFQRACQDPKVGLKPVIAQSPRPCPVHVSRGRSGVPVEGPGNHHAGGAGRSPRDRSGPPGMAGRLPGPRADGSPRAAPQLSLSLGHEGLGIAPADRIAQAAAEADPAEAARRDPRGDPRAHRGARLSTGPVGRDVRRPARRSPRLAQDGPAGLLPLDHGRSGGGDLPHRGLSRRRGAAAGRAVHQHGADRGDPAARRDLSGPDRGRLAVAPALRSASSAPGRTVLAGPGQPLRLSPRRPARRPGPRGGCLLHALCG